VEFPKARKSHRIASARGADAAMKALSVTPFLMAVSAQTFDLLGNDSVIRAFRRPQ
jgi:hypothetical protein